MNLSDEPDDRVSLTKWTGHVEFVDGEPVLDVAIEPVRLLDEDGAAGRNRLQKGEHLPELAATSLLRRLHINELSENRQLLGTRILAQELLLRRDGEALTLLVFRRHSRIQHRLRPGSGLRCHSSLLLLGMRQLSLEFVPCQEDAEIPDDAFQVGWFEAIGFGIDSRS